jgi:hypothetical protein
MRKINAAVVQLLAFTAALSGAAAQQVLRYESATVGSTIISTADVRLMQCINPDVALSERDALVMLINDAFDREAARKLGLLPTLKEVADLNAHINTTTKAPDILEKIKQCFRGDQASYNRLFVEPKIINVKLHAYHSNDSVIQAKPRAAIERAYALAAKGQPFEQIAKTMGLHFFYDTVRVPAVARDSALPQYPSAAGIALTLKSGELYKNIVESNIQYTVLALAKKHPEYLAIACIVANKAAYQPWFLSQVKPLSVLIHSKALASEIRRAYPELWWGAGITAGNDD